MGPNMQEICWVKVWEGKNGGDSHQTTVTSDPGRGVGRRRRLGLHESQCSVVLGNFVQPNGESKSQSRTCRKPTPGRKGPALEPHC